MVGRTAARHVATLAMVALLAAACGSAGSNNDEAAGELTPPTNDPDTTPTTATSSTAPTTSTTDDPPATTAPAETGGIVVIDPGHNGANGAHPEVINQPVDAGGFQKPCNTTGGATPSGVSESSINWQVALLLRDRLEADGVEVIMTRDDDQGAGPCIDERARTAAEADADLLISLHADGAPAELSGFHVIHPALRPGYTDGTVEPSRALAGLVRDELLASGRPAATYAGQDGLHERDDIGTVNLAGAPAVMVEAGNLQNSDDAAWLTSAGGQAQLADALAAAVAAFL